MRQPFRSYNQAYADTQNEQMLLNLARLHNGHPPYFLAEGAINDKFTFAGSATAGGSRTGTDVGGMTRSSTYSQTASQTASNTTTVANQGTGTVANATASTSAKPPLITKTQTLTQANANTGTTSLGTTVGTVIGATLGTAANVASTIVRGGTVGATATAQDSPEFQLIPLNSDLVAKQFLQPSSTDVFFTLYQQGYPIDQLLRLLIESIESHAAQP